MLASEGWRDLVRRLETWTELLGHLQAVFNICRQCKVSLHDILYSSWPASTKIIFNASPPHQSRHRKERMRAGSLSSFHILS